MRSCVKFMFAAAKVLFFLGLLLGYFLAVLSLSAVRDTHRLPFFDWWYYAIAIEIASGLLIFAWSDRKTHICYSAPPAYDYNPDLPVFDQLRGEGRRVRLLVLTHCGTFAVGMFLNAIIFATPPVRPFLEQLKLLQGPILFAWLGAYYAVYFFVFRNWLRKVLVPYGPYF